MNAPSRHLSTRLEPVEPVCSRPFIVAVGSRGITWGVEMSDGTEKHFRSFKSARYFIDYGPLQDQFAKSLEVVS